MWSTAEAGSSIGGTVIWRSCVANRAIDRAGRKARGGHRGRFSHPPTCSLPLAFPSSKQVQGVSAVVQSNTHSGAKDNRAGFLLMGRHSALFVYFYWPIAEFRPPPLARSASLFLNIYIAHFSPYEFSKQLHRKGQGGFKNPSRSHRCMNFNIGPARRPSIYRRASSVRKLFFYSASFLSQSTFCSYPFFTASAVPISLSRKSPR